MSTKEDTTFDLEKALKELEQITKTMESGNLSLEESIANFEKGITLVKKCQTTLQSAEQKVQVLCGEGEKAVLTDYKAPDLDI
jgi:exodeoxyribonuclease VII small subunit